jgi:hypothetical protein
MTAPSISHNRTLAHRSRSTVRETTLRLVGAMLLGAALTIFLFGTSWDIQWHPSVGRDRPLTPPHLMMLGGITLSGLVSLLLILLDTWRARSGAAVDESNSSQIFGLFRAPVGLALSGFGALLATVAFPLDDYWHTLYGIDVTLWAPFHVMIVGGMGMVAVGLLYLLATELNRLEPGRTKTLVQVGFAAAQAATLATFLLLIAQASVEEGLVRAGGVELVIYPALLAFALPISLVSTLWATRQVGLATVVALVFVAIRQLMYLFLPPVMDLLVVAEGLTYRANAPVELITPYNYPVAILLAGVVIDAVYWLARRQGGDGTRALLGAGVVTAVLTTFWDQPWAINLPKFYYPNLDVNAAFLASLPLTIVAALAGAGVAVLLGRGLSTIRN